MPPLLIYVANSDNIGLFRIGFKKEADMRYNQNIECQIEGGFNRQEDMVYIYFLLEPTGDMNVRYVGKTVDPRERYHAYVSNTAQKKQPHLPVMRWLMKIKGNGYLPQMRVIERIPEAEWEARERHWIAHYRAKGFRLLNIQEGGGGQHGFIVPDRVKAKISASLKGHQVSQEARKRISEALIGQKASESAREAVGKASKASWDALSPEGKAARQAKMVSARKPWTDEMRAALAEKKRLRAERTARLQGRMVGVRQAKTGRVAGKWLATLRLPGGARRHLGTFPDRASAEEALEATRKS